MSYFITFVVTIIGPALELEWAWALSPPWTALPRYQMDRRIDLINHQIYDHARHANVEPQRQRPPRDQPVFVEFLQPRAAQRNQNQRHNHNRQDRVRSQQREVNRPDPALPLKEDQLLHAEVIDHVGRQENSGNSERRNHENLVNVPLPRPDCRITSGEEQRANSVERCVEGGMGKHTCQGVLSGAALLAMARSPWELVVSHQAQQ